MYRAEPRFSALSRPRMAPELGPRQSWVTVGLC